MEFATLGLDPRAFAWLTSGVSFGIVLLVGIVQLFRIKSAGMGQEAANSLAMCFTTLFAAAGLMAFMPGAITLAMASFGLTADPAQILFGWLAVAAGVFSFLFGISFGALMVGIAEKSGDPKEIAMELSLDAVN